jgi:UDP:flavonoid glycosyltransferase YjiC (YdhE family)
VLALFPDWFAPKQADWPPQTVVTRFLLYDEGDRTELSPEVEAFLAIGEPPILITPGSANIQAGRFFRVALEVCARLDDESVTLQWNAVDRFSPPVVAYAPPWAIGFRPASSSRPTAHKAEDDP